MTNNEFNIISVDSKWKIYGKFYFGPTQDLNMEFDTHWYFL